MIRQCVIHNSTGGMELVSHDLYKGLVSLGYQVEVVTSSLDDNTSILFLDGVKYIFIKDALKGVYSDEFHQGVREYLDEVVKNDRVPFVIHSVSGAGKSVTKNPYSIPVVATWHGTNIEQELDRMMNYKYVEKKHLLPIHCERLLFNVCNNKKLQDDFQSFDGHIAISSFMKECIMGYGVDASKIAVIRNALPESFFTPQNTPLEFQKPKNKILLGMVGRPVLMKGHGFFCEVLRDLDPEKYELLVVGNKEEASKFFAQSAIKAHYLSVERDMMPLVYSLMDLYINPTFRYSGFDLTVQEALLSGTVVLNSDVGAYQHYYEELQERLKEKSPFFVFRVGDVSSCSAAINRVLVNNIVNNSVEYFSNDFNIKSMLDRYLEFFNFIKR